MGVRPLEDGWRRVAIRPLPSMELSPSFCAPAHPGAPCRRVLPTDTAHASPRLLALTPVYVPGLLAASAAIAVPTGRGVIKLSFKTVVSSHGGSTWGNHNANVTIPGNTRAQICLPRYLFDSQGNNKPVRPSPHGTQH